jgi:hypothetical protein
MRTIMYLRTIDPFGHKRGTYTTLLGALSEARTADNASGG